MMVSLSADSGSQFREAELALQRGDLHRAEFLLGEILAANSEHAEACLMLGQTLLRWEGRVEEASLALQRAREAAPDNSPIRTAYGKALLRKGSATAARAEFAAAANSENWSQIAEWIDGGASLAEFIEEAVAYDELLLIGQSLKAQGRNDDAIAVLERANAHADAGPDAMIALLGSIVSLRRFDRVFDTCKDIKDAALSLSPPHRKILHNILQSVLRPISEVYEDPRLTALLGGLLVENADGEVLAEGVQLLHRAAANELGLREADLGYGNLHLRLGDFGSAMAHYDISEGMEASVRKTLTTLATAEPAPAVSACPELSAPNILLLVEPLCVAQRFQRAFDILNEVIEEIGHWPEAHTWLGRTALFADRMPQALRSAFAARALAPCDPDINMELGEVLLTNGRLHEAWSQFEYRLHTHFVRTGTRNLPLSVPRATHDVDLKGKTVLVWREDGIGDEVRYASCLQQLAAQSGCRVIFECSPKLHPLFARSLPGITVRAENDAAYDYTDVDYHLPMLDLLAWYRRDIADFPTTGEFLKADPDRVDRWRQRLSELGPGPKIGIGWRSLNSSWRKLGTHTSLEDWKPVLRREDLHVINLQIGDVANELSASYELTGRPIHVMEDLDIFHDIDEVAALMCALDGIVTVRCWLSTFGGNLGVPTFCATPLPNQFMFNLAYDPWTPAAQLFYRKPDEDWSAAILAIDQALSARFGGGR